MKNPQGFRGKYFSLAAILAVSTTVTLARSTQSYTDSVNQTQKQETYSESEEETPPQELAPVVVISKAIKVKSLNAPFASEIYTNAQIKRSNSQNLYDFLNTQTSISTMPSFGNQFTQKLDLRGYGVENGYENIVVNVDGKRLNNIDLTPQLLSSIPLEDIQKIEIIKGSGSVEYGDGANAGVINIMTKNHTGVGVKTYIGSNGLRYGALALGIKKEKFSISGYVDGMQSNGEKEIALDGTKNDSSSTNKGIKGIFTPTENVTLHLGKTFSKMHFKYPNALTWEQYNQSANSIPASSYGTDYSEQSLSSDVLSYGLKYKLNKKITIAFQGTNEDKTSDFITYNSINYYDYKTYDTKIYYTQDGFKSVLGIQQFDGERYNDTKSTQKNNLGYYAKVDYQKNHSTISFGARGERVDYRYHTASSELSDRYFLQAYDMGYNYEFDKISSIFINANQSFQAPDVDRFFNAFTNTFNGFIKPMKVQTLNMGYNYLGYPNKTKISLFYSKIKDEIYYNGATYTNTNLDKTRKYGFEVYDKYNIFYNIALSVNYAFVKTKIVSDSANASIVGNEIPGVAAHNIKLSLMYKPTYRLNVVLSHIYKSKAYAMSDFEENLGKMPSYNSTDLSITYHYKQFQYFAKINNIFGRKNALFAYDGYNLGVYPVNYERSFYVGLSARF
ncbi:TonB-dependent receptor plug domain-containing protein [Sulfurospirillum sp. 1612]|uniref:TonB-dependent receptor plug domain-containing protein n=1 Tax=Sulfurospirillum sp. 1612 TaxID=3094835 RepID=UPI002F939EF0